MVSKKKMVTKIPQETESSADALSGLLEGSDDYRSFLRDRKEIMRLIKAMEFLQTFNDRMELQQVLTALYCFYLDEAERSPMKLRDVMDAYSSTVSRNLAAISNVGIRGKQGYKWVVLEEDKDYRNRKNILVTQRGHKVRRMLAAIMAGEV